jgi:MFS family permease
MTIAATYGTLSASEHSTQLRKAVIASTIGTAIEWYDFFLYGTAAGLIFGKLFFPNSDPLTATLAAFGTYFIGFVGRPIGAAIFGHYGDRIGRKKMYLIGATTTGVFGFLYFGMVDTAAPLAVFVAIVLSLIPHDMQYGPQAALIAEAFTPRLRYSGASLGYQLASVIAGTIRATRSRSTSRRARW